MEFLTTDHAKINFIDEGTGPVVILLAGFSGIKEEWQQQIPFLVAQGYRVIAFDARNHGHSTHRQINLKIARLGQDLAELIAHLKLDNVRLIGHSMGSAVIWAYCMLHGTQKVHQIITIDESPAPLPTINWQYGLLDLTWENLFVRSETVMKTKMAQLPIDETVKDVLRAEHQQFPFDFEANQTLLRNHLTQDWRDLITTLTVPQLYLAGGASPLWSSEHVNACITLAQPGLAKKYVFAKAGHLPHLECPIEFNRVIGQFLADY